MKLSQSIELKIIKENDGGKRQWEKNIIAMILFGWQKKKTWLSYVCNSQTF